MSEITAIAEKAAEEIYGHVNTDGFGGIDFERKEIVKIIEEAARAAIEAYEAAKRKAGEPFVTHVGKEINYDPAWAGQTSIHTALDGTRYKATWLDFDKAGGPKLKIEKLP